MKNVIKRLSFLLGGDYIESKVKVNGLLKNTHVSADKHTTPIK